MFVYVKSSSTSHKYFFSNQYSYTPTVIGVFMGNLPLPPFTRNKIKSVKNQLKKTPGKFLVAFVISSASFSFILSAVCGFLTETHPCWLWILDDFCALASVVLRWQSSSAMPNCYYYCFVCLFAFLCFFPPSFSPCLFLLILLYFIFRF